MKKQTTNEWTTHNELNAEPTKARINRLRRHNFLLDMIIAGCVGASIALLFVIVHMMIVEPWTW